MNQQRNSGIDMLKCVLMMGVMLIHIIEHGLGFSSNLQNGVYMWHSGSILEFILICISSVAVNCYFLISGYYGIRYSRKKIAYFVGLMLFYSVLTWIIGMIVGVEHFSMMSVIRGAILGWRSYWFMIVYLIIMLFSEYIDLCIERLNEEQYEKLIVIWFLLNTILGFVLHSNEYGSALSVLPMLFLYCVGSYLRKFNLAGRINQSKEWSVITALCYPIAIVVNIVISLLLFKLNIQSKSYSITIDYCNPLIVIGAVSLFITVLRSNKKWGSHWSTIAPHALSVYLFTETVIARKWVYTFLDELIEFVGPIAMVFYAFCLYAMAICIDYIRSAIIKIIKARLFKEY